MKYLLLVISAVLFIGCSSKEKHHDHDATPGHGHHHKDGEACGCGHEDKCTDKSCSHEGKCTDKSCAHEAEQVPQGINGVAEKVSADLQKSIKPIATADLTKMYTKNKNRIGKTCTAPAMAVCGKTTKDMNVTESEFACLYSKVYRSTREVIPELDNTPCAKSIKKMKM